MKVVYLDVLFSINVVIDYLLLILTSKLSGVYVSRVRLLLGAFVGGIFAVLLFFAPLRLVSSLLTKIILCAGIVIIAFGKKCRGNIIRLCLVFCFTSFCLGGFIFASQLIGTNKSITMQNGVPYLDISPILFIAVTAIAYGCLSLCFGKGIFKKGQSVSCVEAKIGGKSFAFSAMYDSGNCLYEPISRKRVIVVGCREFESIISAEKVREPFSGAQFLADTLGVKIALVPYHAVGVETDFLIGVHPDSLKLDGVECTDYLIGIAPGEISAHAGAPAVIGG